VTTVAKDAEQMGKNVNWPEKREKQLEAMQGELFD
jgi:hypothetical protein